MPEPNVDPNAQLTAPQVVGWGGDQRIFASDTVGNINEAVRLELGGEEILIAESYDIQESVLTQPSAWAIQLGWGGVARDLLAKYPPGTKYQLFIGDDLQSTGWIDARGASQPPNGGTTIRFRGRDALAALQSSDVVSNLTLANPTYPEIVWNALQKVGLAPTTVQWSKDNPAVTAVLKSSNAANRSLKAGVKIVEILPVLTVDEYLAIPTGVIGVERAEIQTKVSERWHAFVRRYLDRAGLFLWAAADGTFILSQPNANQQAAYQLIRRRSGNVSNVVAFDYEDDTTHRHSEYTVFSRGGGKKHGRAKVHGSFDDAEMENVYGLIRPGAIRDAVVQSAAEAAYLARRRLAEERRTGWRLSYTLSGHTLPTSSHANSSRAIVVPDSIVHVDDEEIGINEDLYVESVRRVRGPQTTTEIHLMRKDDLFFGGPDA